MSDEPPESDEPSEPATDAGEDGDEPTSSDGYASDEGGSSSGEDTGTAKAQPGEDTDDGTGSAENTDDDPVDSITEGSLTRPLFHLAWPIVVVQLLQVTYNIVDTLYLGRLSAEAVGAISLAFPLIFLLVAVAGGFTTAGAILVAQYTGARGDRSAGLVTGQTVSFVALLSVVIAVVGYGFTRPALDALPSDPQTEADVVPLAADYLEIIFLGVPLMFGFFVFTAVMRGYGDTRTPMLVMVISVVVNAVADPFLIFGFANNPLFGWADATPLLGRADFAGLEATLFAATGFEGWGIEGAAVATVLARGSATAVGLWLLFATSRGPDVTIAHLSPDLETIGDIVRLGTPSMLEQTASAGAMIVLTAIVVTFSPEIVAAYGLGNRLISLVFLPAMGLGRAIDTMVGQNLGAGHADRAARAVRLAATTGAGVMLIVAVVAVTFAEPIVSVFLGDVENAPAVIEAGTEYVRIRSVEFAFIGVSQVILGGFRGAGNTVTAMVISMATLWVGRVGSVALLVFVFGWGPTGIWVGMAVGNVLGAIIGVAWFARGTWTDAYIDRTDDGTDSRAGDDRPASTAED